LLRENTLLAVVTFPPELFSPVGVRTCGIFVKKGVEQGAKKVLWLRIMHDGFRLKKGRRIEVKEEQDDLKNVKENVRSFLKNQDILLPNIPEFQKITSINYPPNPEDDVDNPLYDKELELCPEAYLDEKPVSTQEMNELIDKLMREALAFNIKFEREIQYANRQIE